VSAGQVDPAPTQPVLPGPFRRHVHADVLGQVRQEGDFRDWTEIEAWAEEIASELAQTTVPVGALGRDRLHALIAAAVAARVPRAVNPAGGRLMPGASPCCYPLPGLIHPPEPKPRGGPMTDLATNVLSYGDNLDILRRYLPDVAVDLVYLDPPFNSNRDDNVIFRDESGNATDAQLLAFEDT